MNKKDETVWLNANQISELFNRDVKTIRKHINNSLEEEGERDVTRYIEYYNLDMIISVGYRVKSNNGIIFSKWANKVLKDYLLKGYAVNKKRLEYLEKTVKLIDIASRIDDELTGNDAKEIIKVINNYANALNLLNDHDYKKIIRPNGNSDNRKITYEEGLEVINKI